MVPSGPMKDRRDRILDVAVELAEAGGFDNVRQRDVAAQAGVALGTLYKTFRSKEDILCAALEREAAALELRMEAHPAKGDLPAERLRSFFQTVTRGLCRKPNFTRAVLRAMASGEPEVAGNVAAYQGRVNGLIVAVLRGVGRLSLDELAAAPPNELESTVADMLQQIWFASLVGWSAGIISQIDMVERVDRAGRVLLRGLAEPA